MRFIEKIAQGKLYDPDKVKGYSSEELEKIERLYDINIYGDFRDFMLEMGRSSGGLIGDDTFILYYKRARVRDHIMIQLGLGESFQEYDIDYGKKLMEQKPFLFSIESDTQHFFITTKSRNSDMVYQYDANDKIVKDTNLTFLEYMKKVVKYYYARGIVCTGDLLTI